MIALQHVKNDINSYCLFSQEGIPEFRSVLSTTSPLPIVLFTSLPRISIRGGIVPLRGRRFPPPEQRQARQRPRNTFVTVIDAGNLLNEERKLTCFGGGVRGASPSERFMEGCSPTSDVKLPSFPCVQGSFGMLLYILFMPPYYSFRRFVNEADIFFIAHCLLVDLYIGYVCVSLSLSVCS